MNQKAMPKQVEAVGSPQYPDAVEHLVKYLSSPRLHPRGTIIAYRQTALHFLRGRDDHLPAADDFRDYFIARRKTGISERSLHLDFYALKMLAKANKWDWPFDSRDAPISQGGREMPPLPIADVERLIGAWRLYSKAELFYLANSTMYGCRREELSLIKKRDFDEETILLHIVKHGRPTRHAIPDVLKPVFEAYRPKEHSANSLTNMWHRICRKAGVKFPPRVNWHGIRRDVRTLLEWSLAKEGLPLSLVADYMGWSTTAKGMVYGGSAMIGVYGRTELISSDPFYVDHLIYPVHPFLKLWEQALGRKRAIKGAGVAGLQEPPKA